MLIVTALANGHWEAAIAHADTLLDVEPEKLYPLHLKAIALRGLGRPEAALAALEREIAAEPTAKSLCLRGCILLELEREDEARAAFAGAVQVEPEDPGPAARLGCLDSYRRDSPMIFVSIGWFLCSLRMSPLLWELNGRPTDFISVTISDLDRALRSATGGGLGLWAGEEAVGRCVSSLRHGSLDSYRKDAGALDDNLRRRVAEDFPPRAAQWVRWGGQLNWHQFMFGSVRRDWADGDPDARSESEELEADFLYLTGDIRSDERFLSGCPEMAPIIERLHAAAGRAFGVEKLDAIHAHINEVAQHLHLP